MKDINGNDIYEDDYLEFKGNFFIVQKEGKHLIAKDLRHRAFFIDITDKISGEFEKVYLLDSEDKQ